MYVPTQISHDSGLEISIPEHEVRLACLQQCVPSEAEAIRSLESW